MRRAIDLRPAVLVAVALATAGCTLDVTGTRASEGGKVWTAPGSGGATGQGGASTTDPTTTSGAGGTSTTTATTTSTGSGGAGGATTTTTTGVGGGGGAGGATTTTTVVAEDCTNGVDDDGDGDADCVDTECQVGFMCVPAPAGGTVSFFGQRAASAPPNECGPLKAEPTLFTGLDTPVDGCACTCGELAGGVCNLEDWAVFLPSGNCSGPGWKHPADQCMSLAGYGAVQSVQTSTTWVGKAGACTPGVAGTPKTATFSVAIDRCRASTANPGGCAPGNACVPRPPAPIGTSACVEVAPGAACPAGLPHLWTLYEGVNDGRACATGTCGCGAVQNATCAVAYELFTDGACATAPAASVPMDGACHATGFAAGTIHSAKYATKQGGTCPATGQAATTGQAVGTGAHALCCQTP